MPEERKKVEDMKDEGKNVICPKCDKNPLRISEEKVYCRLCGMIGSQEEVRKIFSDKREKERQLNADFMCPLLPEKLEEDGSALNRQFNMMVEKVRWLSRHFTREDNFKCPRCNLLFSPRKKKCPQCFPTGPASEGAKR